MLRKSVGALLVVLLLVSSLRAGVGSELTQQLYNRISPSLVAVQYTWDSEMGRREIIGAGVVVGEDGLVMASLAVFSPRIPDEQMKDFKIIVPSPTEDEQELEAVFVGRDERTDLAFLKTKDKQHWKAVQFQESAINVGDPVISVGLLPKAAGYKAYAMESQVAAMLRGEVPQVLVGSGGLAAVGSPVFNPKGEAIGFVNFQTEQSVLLNDPKNPLAAVMDAPKFFIPARDFAWCLHDLPTAGEPMKLPWLGLPQLAGLKKDVAEFFGLKGQPAVEVGDVIPGSPADKAGIKRGQIILKMNGMPLERGDEPEELAMILHRKLSRMKVGQKVTLTVLEKRGEPLKDITVTLEERPKPANLAKRFHAEDLGFAARETVFYDLYLRKLPADTKGVLVAWVKPQGSAQNGHLQPNDLVTEINDQPVSDLEQFQKAYRDFRAAKPQDAVVLVVIRDSNTQVIRIEPPQ